MATIWWCKTAKQYAVDLWRKGAKKRFYLGKNKRAAEKRRADILQELQAQEPEEANPALSLEDLSESFLQYAHDNKAESTYEFYRHLLSAFVRAHRGWAVADITPIELEAFKRKLLAENLAPTTINHHLNVVQIMFNWAVKFGYMKAHELNRVEKLKKPKGRIRFLSEDEEAKLLAASGPLFRDMLLFFLNTGLRTSELAELTWEDVDLDHGVLTVRRSKTERTAHNYRPRRIPLTREALAILGRQPHRAGHVFLNDDGQPFNRGTLRLRFNRVRRRAGVGDVTLHTLRHTFASRLSMNGENLQTVAALLGHTNTRTTEIYSHLADEHLRRAMERLERSHEGETSPQAAAQPHPAPRRRARHPADARATKLSARPDLQRPTVVVTKAV